MEPSDAAVRWSQALRDAWTTGEVDGFVALYRDDAVFRGPFTALEPAIDHMRRALALGDPEPSVWVGTPVVQGGRAAVEWWAVIVADGGPRSFAATAWLRFDDDGLVVEEHDYWQSAEGRREPWPEWGR